MKKISVSVQNISKPIIGKATLSNKGFWRRKKYIFLADKIENNPRGYSAYLFRSKMNVTDENPQKNVALILSSEGFEFIHEGDVLAISPQGQLNVLYESASKQNAIFLTDSCNCKCIMCPQTQTDCEDSNLFKINQELIRLEVFALLAIFSIFQ